MRRVEARRSSLLLLATLVTLPHTGCGGEEGGDAGAAASVLLVTIDTLRADHLGAYGYPEPVRGSPSPETR